MGSTSQRAVLRQAATALWLATLSLMTAYMHNSGPAHRLMLARRIARNLDTLSGLESFGDDTRRRFSGLSAHWTSIAAQLALPALGQGEAAAHRHAPPLRVQ